MKALLAWELGCGFFRLVWKAASEALAASTVLAKKKTQTF
jgi:hypothetical protein